MKSLEKQEQISGVDWIKATMTSCVHTGPVTSEGAGGNVFYFNEFRQAKMAVLTNVRVENEGN